MPTENAQRHERHYHRSAMNATIYITLGAVPTTSTTEISLAEKLQILRKCYDSCAAEGLPIVLIAMGDRAGVEEVRKVIPGVPLWGVFDNLDRQRGECAVSLRALEDAEKSKMDWLIKVAGDTFHPTPGWAEALIELAQKSGAELVATAHHRPDWVTTQVYAVKPAFMRKTWPPMDADYGRIGIEAQWGERIAAAGLLPKWYKPDACHLVVDGCDNMVPVDKRITYLHAHCLTSAANWAVADMSIIPDIKAKISVVVPARNETQLNPNRGNVPLLSDTFSSIAETSPQDNLPECILVDDGSNIPLPACPYPGALRTIRNVESIGVDPARNLGILTAHGDVIGVLDGHMRVESQSGEPCMLGLQKLAAVALEKQAIVVAGCAHLEMPMHSGLIMFGGNFTPITNPKQPLAMDWHVPPTPPRPFRKINGLLGASYFAPREVWRKLQNFVDSCTVWGFSEEGLALKAAFCNVPIYTVGEVTVSHWFRGQGPHVWPVDDWHRWINRARVLYVTFDRKTFQEFWLPRCKGSIWNAQYDALLLEHCLIAEAARFQAIKERTDVEVLADLFKVTV